MEMISMVESIWSLYELLFEDDGDEESDDDELKVLKACKQ